MAKESSLDILEKVRSFISEGVSHCQKKHRRCEENNRYAAGEQWNAGDILKQALRDRPAVPWNGVLKAINLISNREIVERFQPKVFGRSFADRGIANVLDEWVRWQRDMAESEHIESMAVRAMVTSGYGCAHKYWDPVKFGGEGQVMDEDVPIWEMLWPSSARQTNLIDRRWHVRGKWFPIAQAEALFGDINKKSKKYFKEFKNKKKIWDSEARVNNPFYIKRYTGISSAGWTDIANGQWFNMSEESMFIAEAEWIDYETIFKCAIPTNYDMYRSFMMGELPSIEGAPDPMTGQPTQMDLMTFQQMDEYQKEVFIQSLFEETAIEFIETKAELQYFIEEYLSLVGRDFEDYRKVEKQVIKYALITDDNLWDYGERVYGYTYEFMTGWRIETRQEIDYIGVVDVVKGPQDYKNAIMSNMLSLYMTSPKSPLLIESDAAPNIHELVDQFAKPDAIVIVPPGFLNSGKYKEMPSPTFPQMMPLLLQIASQGVDEALNLSSVEQGTQGDLRRVSGNVVQAARMAGNMNVANLFDSIRQFRKRYTLLNLRFLQEQYSVQSLLKIVGEEKANDMQLLMDSGDAWKDISKFDIKVDEEPVSATERMEQFEKLSRTGSIDMWLQQKFIDFESALDLMPYMPESTKRQILERNNVAQQREQELQQQMQGLQAQIDSQITQLNIFGQVLKLHPAGKEIENVLNLQQNMAIQIEENKAQKAQQQPQEGMPPTEGMPPPETGGTPPPMMGGEGQP